MSRQEKMSRVMMLDIYWIQQFSSSGSECTWSHVMHLKYGASRGSFAGFHTTSLLNLPPHLMINRSSLDLLLAAQCCHDALVLPVVPPSPRPIIRGQSCSNSSSSNRCHSHLLEQSSAVPLAVRGNGFIQGNLSSRKPCTQLRLVGRRAKSGNAFCIHVQDVSASVWP